MQLDKKQLSQTVISDMETKVGRMKRSYEVIMLLIVSITYLAFSIGIGCNSQTTSEFRPPLYIGLAYDVSGSVNELGLETLTRSHLQHMIDILGSRGGTMAFGLVDDNAFEPLVRIELVPVVGRLDERAERNALNQEGIRRFLAVAESKLNRPRNAQRTDIKGAIARFALFFGEPTIRVDAQKVMIFLSDGIDTGPWRKLSSIRLPQDVTVFAVGMQPDVAQKLFGDRVTLFEAIGPAVESLKVPDTEREVR